LRDYDKTGTLCWFQPDTNVGASQSSRSRGSKGSFPTGECGSPVPDPKADEPWLEVHAGVLDDDPGLRPERHILVEAKSPWFTISDELTQLDRAALTALRDSR